MRVSSTLPYRKIPARRLSRNGRAPIRNLTEAVREVGPQCANIHFLDFETNIKYHNFPVEDDQRQFKLDQSFRITYPPSRKTVIRGTLELRWPDDSIDCTFKIEQFALPQKMDEIFSLFLEKFRQMGLFAMENRYEILEKGVRLTWPKSESLPSKVLFLGHLAQLNRLLIDPSFARVLVDYARVRSLR